MIPLAQLRAQHEEIGELMTVLSLLIHDDNSRATTITLDLFKSLSEKVRAHIALEDSTLYKELLVHEDPEIKRVARNFLSGSHHLKRCLGDYMQRACTPHSTQQNCSAFIKETEEVFGLLNERIRTEETKFYPLAESRG